MLLFSELACLFPHPRGTATRGSHRGLRPASGACSQSYFLEAKMHKITQEKQNHGISLFWGCLSLCSRSKIWQCLTVITLGPFFKGLPGEMPRNTTDTAMRRLEPRGPSSLGLSFLACTGGCYIIPNILSSFTFNDLTVPCYKRRASI